MFSTRVRLLLRGGLLWAAGTILIRLQGHRLLDTGRPLLTLLLYLVSAPALAIFSCLFFQTLFPNVQPAAAGLFGGWMLICCGGAIAGAFVKR